MLRTERTRAAAWLAGLSGLAATLAWACGPFFPPSMLLDGSTRLLSSPAADFGLELARVTVAAPPFASDDVTGMPLAVLADCRDAERASLRTVLVARGLADARIDEILTEVDAFCRLLSRPREAVALDGAVLRDLPAEYRHFFQAVGALASQDERQAKGELNALLQLPAADRRERTVWARFLLGWLDRRTAPDEAVRQFVQSRAEVQAGFADPCRLAAESFGWQAYVELHRGNLEQAAELYLVHGASGDATAWASLIQVARRVRDGDDELLRRAARHPELRSVFTAFVLAWGGPRQVRGWSADPPVWSQRWLAVLEAEGVTQTIGADRAAWLAYEAGDHERALRWAALAPADAPMALWIRAKCLAARGELDEAAPLFARASKAFPPQERWYNTTEDEQYDPVSPHRQAMADAGALQVARGEFIEALDLLRRAGLWRDAAHIAERVLTPVELKTYVDAHCPPRAALAMPGPGDDEESSGWGSGDLRHLLGRRLVRLGRIAEAIPYFAPEHHLALRTLNDALSTGRDISLPKPRRAAALWQAAQITRLQGIELMGTELAPDWFIFGGNFELGTLEEQIEWRSEQGVLSASEAERTRFAAEPLEHNNRFHYRYIAADLAWEAALLMPDNSDETALVLCRAGTWLKNRDPKAADRFYKALVRRCRQTPLGQQADTLRWFPELPGSKEEG